MTPDLGIEPGPHWWEARALTTAPSLHLANLVDGVTVKNGFPRTPRNFRYMRSLVVRVLCKFRQKKNSTDSVDTDLKKCSSHVSANSSMPSK